MKKQKTKTNPREKVHFVEGEEKRAIFKVYYAIVIYQ